jgi:hypothetical protein
MTRFKELRRIEVAIEHRNKQELLWSLSVTLSGRPIYPMLELPKADNISTRLNKYPHFISVVRAREH